MQRASEAVVLGVGAGFAGEMLRRQFEGSFHIGDMGLLIGIHGLHNVIDLSAGRAAALAGARLHATGRRMHISECYAELLGVSTEAWHGDFTPLTGWAGPVSPHAWTPYVLIAPFSRSCARNAGLRPNKTPDHERWGLLISQLRSTGFEPVVLLGVDEYWTGTNVATVHASSLQTLEVLLRRASAVISVDNGIGHVASALGCRTLILWPPISSVPFIGPVWNKKTTLLYMHPERIRAPQLRDIVMKEVLG